MIKKMLVNATHPEENRVAIVEDGILSELDIEIAGQEQTKGNIYKAAVVRVETGLQAAFVDYGAERLGFLQVGELHPSLYPQKEGEENKSRPRINEILHRGQELLVQITKEERGNKGAALTTFLSLPGRYMVLMPGDDARGISRKIPDGAERKALRQAIAAMDVPEDMGIIVRTAAIGKTSEELQRDLDYLLKLHGNITSHAKQTKAPALIYQESNLVIRSIRDYFMPDMDEVLIDDPDVFKEAKEFFTQVMPDHANLVKLHQEQRPVFSKYQIEEQIETIAQSQVSMPSGGSIVIDQTEALVAIDVNSGKMASEQGIEATAYKSNLEAASEVARQLRLRDLGGLVVIDFIDMRDRKHTREVEKRLKEALKNDKARVTVGRISQFGLLEMSRQRIKQSLAAAAWNACPHCKGRGKVKSTEAQAVAIMRKIHAAVAKKQIERVEAKVPAEVAEYLLNTRREELLDMERRYKTAIYLSGGHDLAAEEVEVEFKKREKRPADSKDESAPVTAATALADTVAAERPHQPAASEAGEESTQPHPPTQKKRTRRSRGAAAKAEESNQEATPEQTTGEQPATDQSAPASEQTTTEETATEAPRRRRRRRRGRRGGSQNATEATTGSAGVEESDTPEATQTVETEQPEATVDEEAKPKRRGRRRKPAAADHADATPETSAVSAENAAGEESTEAAPEPATEEQAAKPKRRRSPRKKAEPAAADAPIETKSVETTPEQPQALAVEPAAEEPPAKPKRRRSPRKKNEETAAATTESTSTDQEKPSEEKPKRRRPGRPKKATEPVAAAVTEQAPVTAPAASESGEVKPKPRRRAAAKKAKSDDTTAAASGPEVAQPEAEKPKPARRPRRTKKAEPSEVDTATTEVKPAEEKPAAKPRRRPAKSKKADEVQTQPAATESAPSAEGDAEQKPKRRRSPRKKASPEGDSAE